MNEIITEKNFQKPVENQPVSKVVKFTNFSSEDFTWTWNNIPYTFKAGEFKFMEIGIAKHFAKHLVNRELLKRGHENDTSPKIPEQNVFFMEMYNRCISDIPTDGGPTDQTKNEQEVIDMNMRAKLGISTGKAEEKKEEKEFEEIEVPEDEEEEFAPEPEEQAQEEVEEKEEIAKKSAKKEAKGDKSKIKSK